jgi:hypothetical protein
MAPAPPPEDDDDFELELEPVDPEVVARQRQRVQEKTDEAASKVDVDEILRKKDDEGDYYVDWSFLKGLRFTTRHVLVLTALLAVLMTMFRVLGGCNAIFILVLIGVGVGWFFVLKRDQRRAREREQLRKDLLAGRPLVATTAEDVQTLAAPQPRFDVKFQFSMKEMLIAMTVAAVFLGLMYQFGPESLAMTLGIVALGGLAVNAAGFDPPRMVVLGWWVLLVFYLIFGLMVAVGTS